MTALSTPAVFVASVSATDEADALARVDARLARHPQLDGLATTGRTGVRSAKHLIFEVEVAMPDDYTRASRNDAWVLLTSYGISPSPALGSTWERTLGASA